MIFNFRANWLCGFQSLKFKISRLLQARSSLIFTHLQRTDSLSTHIWHDEHTQTKITIWSKRSTLEINFWMELSIYSTEPKSNAKFETVSMYHLVKKGELKLLSKMIYLFKKYKSYLSSLPITSDPHLQKLSN